MNKSHRPSSLNKSIKLSLKNSIINETRKLSNVYSTGKPDEHINKKSAYAAYKYFNTKNSHQKQKSYQFELSSSQISERTKPNITNIKSVRDEKHYSRDIKSSIS
jgi:hypothetical protein